MTEKNSAAMTPEDEVAYWRARHMSGALTDAERADFESWLAASEKNRRLWSELEEALNATDVFAEDILAQEFERELLESSAAKRLFAPSRASIAACAAALVAVVALSILFIPRSQDLETYATAVGESAEISLQDGSLIQLNTATTLSVAFSTDERAVRIEDGEAMFNVSRDRQRPFVVETPHAQISVTGTLFDVSTFGGKSTVYVLSGTVEVLPRQNDSITLVAGDSIKVNLPESDRTEPRVRNRITLLAGDSVSIDANGVATRVSPFDPNEMLAWRTGKARFREAPLQDVVGQLNRYFTKPLSLSDPSLNDLPVTGDFDTRDQQTAVRALQQAFSLDVREEPERIILSLSR
ncbi:MAG: FecR domain-containing protein [Pseudomonadota bacterium]|nr:FecR domain-containing protein [Pseudomonadota bacterium]